MDTFNKRKVKGSALTHLKEAVIVDEVPPYMWTGRGEVGRWLTDLMKNDKQQGVAEETVKIGAATRLLIDGDTAYVVVPSTYTFTQKGTPMKEALR